MLPCCPQSIILLAKEKHIFREYNPECRLQSKLFFPLCCDMLSQAHRFKNHFNVLLHPFSAMQRQPRNDLHPLDVPGFSHAVAQLSYV